MYHMTKLLVKHYTDTGGYGFYRLEPCCPEFQKAWDEHAIGFGRARAGFDCLEFQTGFNIYQTITHWEDDNENTDWKISFCPFCGKPLEARVVFRGLNKYNATMEKINEVLK
jgi:hypothetical protein